MTFNLEKFIRDTASVDANNEISMLPPRRTAKDIEGEAIVSLKTAFNNLVQHPLRTTLKGGSLAFGLTSGIATVGLVALAPFAIAVSAVAAAFVTAAGSYSSRAVIRHIEHKAALNSQPAPAPDDDAFMGFPSEVESMMMPPDEVFAARVLSPALPKPK